METASPHANTFPRQNEEEYDKKHLVDDLSVKYYDAMKVGVSLMPADSFEEFAYYPHSGHPLFRYVRYVGMYAPEQGLAREVDVAFTVNILDLMYKVAKNQFSEEKFEALMERLSIFLSDRTNLPTSSPDEYNYENETRWSNIVDFGATSPIFNCINQAVYHEKLNKFPLPVETGANDGADVPDQDNTPPPQEEDERMKMMSRCKNLCHPAATPPSSN